MKQARLKDIAEKVKLSQTAVSKVLNNNPIRISDKKKNEILKTAQKLNYRPNLIARGLKNNKTKSIGIVVPDITNLFYPELIKNIEISLGSYDYQTIICNTKDDPSLEKYQIENLLSLLIDGLIISPVSNRENIPVYRRICERKIPFIMFDRYFKSEQFPFVITDNKESARKGVRWFAQQKITKIYYLGEKKRNQPIDDRLEGIKEEAIKKCIIFRDKDIFLSGTDREEIRKKCKTIINKGLNQAGIFLESNRFLMGLLDACIDNGIFIPDDFKTIGFDSFTPEILYPEDFKALRAMRSPIPIIEQDICRIGKSTTDYLISCLEKESKLRWQKKIPAKLIIPQ